MAAVTPNTIFILTDQQRSDTLSCYAKDTVCQTRHLNGLAEQSTVFHNAYTVCAVCSPARASLQTGLYPHAHGVEANIYGRGCRIHELPDGESLLSRRLQQAGYSVGYTGKWHLGEGGAAVMKKRSGLRASMAPEYSGLPTDVGYEGDDFPGHGAGGYQYPQFKEYLASNQLNFDVADRNNYGGHGGHTTTGEIVSPTESTNEHFLVNQAIQYIDQFRLRDQPFCLQLHFWGPHEPFYAPTQFLDLYRTTEIPTWRNLDENRTLKPSFHDVFRRPDEPWSFWENSLRHYYGFVTSIDAQIGRLLEHLKQHSLYDNTTIIFSSDHGDSQGCHGGIENKSYHMYEETVRIPLFIKSAQPNSERSDVTAFVNTCDIYASILDNAGLPTELAEAAHGRSLLPFLRGERPEGWRNFVVCQGLSATSTLCTHRMIRKGNWKYIFYASGTDELYNLKDDPWEITNRIAEPSCQDIRVDLQRSLYLWMDEYGDDLRRDYGQLRPASVA